MCLVITTSLYPAYSQSWLNLIMDGWMDDYHFNYIMKLSFFYNNKTHTSGGHFYAPESYSQLDCTSASWVVHLAPLSSQAVHYIFTLP
jgi:hypothetical protein